MGDGDKTPLRLQFNPKVRLEFHGATITSDAGLLPIRELDDALGLTHIAADYLQESRSGRNIRHVDPGKWRVVTSIDDIDPKVCNPIHNINACTPEELEELGLVPVTGSVVAGHAEVEGDPEPLFVDGEAQYRVQSLEETVEQDCRLARGTVYLSSEGQVGYAVVHDLEDGEVGETQEQPPVVMPQVLPTAE